MRIVVIGRRGQVAQSLVEAAASAGSGIEAVALGRPGCDLARIEELPALIDNVAPDLVINTGQYTGHESASIDADRALLVNGAAAGAIAATCNRRGIPIIHMSGAAVFDGTASGPYGETDPTSPASIFGASKLLGEQLVASSAPRHLILRTGWLFGPFGARSLPARPVDDQPTTPTYAPHLAAAIFAMAKAMVTAATDDAAWGIYHVASQGEATWTDLAHELGAGADARGRDGPYVAIASNAGPSTDVARRLDVGKLAAVFGITLPPWQDGVRDCVVRLRAMRA